MSLSITGTPKICFAYRWQIPPQEEHLKFGSAGPIFWANLDRFCCPSGSQAHYRAPRHIKGRFCWPPGTWAHFQADFLGTFWAVIGHPSTFWAYFVGHRAPWHIFGPIFWANFDRFSLAIGHWADFAHFRANFAGHRAPGNTGNLRLYGRNSGKFRLADFAARV